MAILENGINESGVQRLVTNIKHLSDQTYVPLTRTINNKALSSNITLTALDVDAATDDHMHSEANGDHTLGYATGLSVSTSAWTSSSTAITTTTDMLVYMYASVRVAGLGLGDSSGQTRPIIFCYESDHARRSPVYFLPAGTYYIYVKGTSSSTNVTVYLRHVRIT